MFIPFYSQCYWKRLGPRVHELIQFNWKSCESTHIEPICSTFEHWVWYSSLGADVHLIGFDLTSDTFRMN